MDYIESTSNLFAFMYRMQGHTDREQMKNVVNSMDIKEFVPKKNVKIGEY